jgi:peroxiredoxin
MRTTWTGPVAFAVCLVTATAPARADDADVATLLKRYGIRPVEPPSRAADFTLPALDGSTLSLSSAKGRWVVLTFFATWCGPCAAEMPSLERLHQARRDQGLDVLGVALDSDAAAVRAYATKKGVSFVVVVDSDGSVGGTYQASSIPVGYVIDPTGRIVGVARGARDWGGMADLFASLAQIIPADPNAESLYAAAGGSVELPAKLVPPTAEVTLSDETAQVGREFAVDVRITWDGNFDDYLLHPPSIHLPEQVERLGVSAQTSTEAGAQVVAYEIRLVATEEGSFALDPVELRYTPRLESAPVAARIAGPTVQVTGASFTGLLPILLGVGGVLLLTAGGVAGGTALRRRRRPARTNPAAPSVARLHQVFEEARKQRLDGNIAEFLSSAAEIERLLDAEASTPERTELDDLEERARYGGMLPGREQLDQIQRRIERRLAEITPDEQREARSQVRLNETREP